MELCVLEERMKGKDHTVGPSAVEGKGRIRGGLGEWERSEGYCCSGSKVKGRKGKNGRG